MRSFLGTILFLALVGGAYGQINVPSLKLFPEPGGANAAFLDLYEKYANGTNYVGFAAPSSVASSFRWTLPSADGTANQALLTNGSGTLFFGTVATSVPGEGSCTNQFVRGITNGSAPTCATVAAEDVEAALRTDQFGFVIFDPANDLTAAYDVDSIFSNRARAITLTEVWCETDVSTASINFQKNDGSPIDGLSSALVCTTSGATSTSFVSGQASIAVGNKIDFEMVSVGTGVRRVSVTFKYTVN